MDNNDPIFVFKQHFSKNDAQAVISSLIHHRIIWNQLVDAQFLDTLLAVLPLQKESWTAANVSLAAAGLSQVTQDKQLLLGKIEPQYLPAEQTSAGHAKLQITLEQVAPIAAGLIAEEQSHPGWTAFLQSKGLHNLTQLEIMNSWGTTFSLVYFLLAEKEAFVSDLGNADSSSMKNLLAFIICANPLLTEMEFTNLSRMVEEVKLTELTRLLESMEVYETKGIGAHLADHYLEAKPIDTVPHDEKKGVSRSGEELLGKIDLFKNYAILAQFSSRKDLADIYSQKALDLSEQLNRSLEELKNTLHASENSSVFAISKTQISSNDAVGRILQAAQVKDTDPEAARKIGKQIHQDICGSHEIPQFLTSDNQGMVISPLQVVNLLLDLDLVKEAAQSADQLIEYQPLNIALLGKAAELNYQYGDYQKAAQYYSRMEVSQDLTREEKLRLTDALEQCNLWKEALAVWKNTNLVSLDDYQRKAIVCYRANDRHCFEETIQSVKNFYSSEGLFQVLQALFDLENGKPDSAQVMIDAFLNHRKRDRYAIRFLLEYYQKTAQTQEAISLVRSLSSLEANLPEIYIKRYELAEQMTDDEECRRVLQQASQDDRLDDLSATEKLMEFCMHAHALEGAEGLLERNLSSWILSPKLAGFQARLFNEQGKFAAAREILASLVQRKDVQTEWLIDYGLALLESNRENFPLGETRRYDERADMPSEQLVALLDQYPDNLFLQIIQTELNPENALNRYQKMLSKDANHLNPDIWRVHAGMGKYYYQHGQFDLAVVNFREAGKQQPQKKALNLMLVKALGKISLYEDGLAVFSGMLTQGNLDLADMLEINDSLKQADQWLQSMEKFSESRSKTPAIQIVLAQLYAERKQPDKVIRSIRKSGLAEKASANESLICAQLLIQAGSVKEARRMLEGFLSDKKNVQDQEYLTGAFLYVQLGEFHKAANLLNLIGHADYAVLALKADLYQKLDMPKEALSALHLALDLLEQAHALDGVQPMRWIQAPDFWEETQRYPQHLYAHSVKLRMAMHDYKGALEEARQRSGQNPQDVQLSTLTLNLARLSGEKELSETILENAPDLSAGSGFSEDSCVWGEVALQYGQEILAANILSQCLELFPESVRVKALQARLLERNGNHADAQALMDELLTAWNTQTDENLTGQHEAPIWMAEAALDLNRNVDALRICEQMIPMSGLTRFSTALFLHALAKISFNNWLNEKLDIDHHLDPLNELDEQIFNDICVSPDLKIRNDPRLQSLISEIKLWLDERNCDLTGLMNIDSETISPYALIVATHLKEGSQKTDILMERFSQDATAKMVMAMLELDSNPAKTVEYDTELMRAGQVSPQHYALLSLAKQKLGQPADAYAAINLALASWPEEYKWQIRAGKLSKSLGDIHASLDHFKKAAEIHQDENTQVYLGELNLQAGNSVGIAYLEKKLNGSRQDFETLLQLGELSLKNNKPQKAARYLENARKINPNDAQVYLLLSQVASMVGNFAKAKEIINEADHLQRLDVRIILQKAIVIEKSDGVQPALDYLSHVNDVSIQSNVDVMIRQASYLAELNGAEKALEYLLPKSYDSDNDALLLETAKYYISLENLDMAEEFTERALQANPENPYPLEMLAKISSQSGDLDKSVDFLVKAIQGNPFIASFYIELARIYQSRRDFKQALETLQSGLRSNPLNFDLLNALGLLYYQQGQYQRAEESLQQASSINPRDENIKRLLSTIGNANIIQGSMHIHTLAEEV